MKPGDVHIQPGGILIDAFGNAEAECAGALVVRWHQAQGLDEWTPVARRTLAAFLDADDIVRRWAQNPVWRPAPWLLRDHGWITGWQTADEPGVFTEKALAALGRRASRQGHAPVESP